MLSASWTCEKPFTSAPRKPSSLTQRVSSLVASSGSCIGRAASAWKRSGPLAHLLGEKIVGAARDLVGALRVEDRLDRRRVEREDHHLDAVPVHLGDAPLVEIDQPAAQLRPGVVGQEPLGIRQRVVGGEMLFQPDLALHRLPRFAFTRFAPFLARRLRLGGLVRPPPARQASHLQPIGARNSSKYSLP